MTNSTGITEGLKKIFSEFSNLDELPHSFDDSLISKFVDFLKIDENICHCILKEIKARPFGDHSKISRLFLSKLVEKLIICENTDKYEMTNYMEESLQSIFDKQDSDSFLDILSICIAFYRFTPPPDVLIEQCISFLPDEVLSIFARRNMEDLVCLASTKILEDILNSVVQIFCSTQFPLIRNGLCRILEAKIDHISSKAKAALIENVQKSKVEGEIVYKLIANILPEPLIAADPKLWSSEIVRTAIAVIITKRLESSDVREQLVLSILDTKRPKLRHFIELLPSLTKEVISQFLPVFLPQLENKSLCPISDIVNFVGTACSLLDREEVYTILQQCKSRLFDSHAVLEKVYESYGSEVIEDPKLNVIKEHLISSVSKAIDGSEWETKDTAVEIVTLFPSLKPFLGKIEDLILEDSSPYVRAAALRCFLKYESSSIHVTDLCAKVFNNDNDHEPRRVAILHLESVMPDSSDQAVLILSKALEDPDIDIRNTIISICAKYLIEHPLHQKLVKTELLEWVEDPEIGSRIRALLGVTDGESTQDPAEHILAEMMIGLSIGCAEEIDCY